MGHRLGSERAYVNNYLITDNICYGKGPFLLGGGWPSHGIRVYRNYLYGVDVRIGYSAPYNEDCKVRSNVVVNGRLEIAKYRKVVQQGDLVLAENEDRPAGAKSILLPNKYDSSRIYLAVYNWEKANAVDVKTGGLLHDGDTVEMLDPKNLFGDPVARATCRGDLIRVLVQGEFAAFVLRVSRK